MGTIARVPLVLATEFGWPYVLLNLLQVLPACHSTSSTVLANTQILQSSVIQRQFTLDIFQLVIFMLDALALSVIATAAWLAGWVAGCLSQPVLYQND